MTPAQRKDWIDRAALVWLCLVGAVVVLSCIWLTAQIVLVVYASYDWTGIAVIVGIIVTVLAYARVHDLDPEERALNWEERR